VNKIIVAALAISLFAGSAQAQTGPLGGFIPWTVNAPAAAMSGSAAPSPQAQGRCETTWQGRSGPHNVCDESNQRGEKR
jgi:hypothetical protein